MTARIGFIGAGKMAEALIAGLIAKNVYTKDEIIACAPSQGTRDHMCQTYGIRMFATASEVAAETKLAVLAVKPKQRNVPSMSGRPATLCGFTKTLPP